jgi:hypothetical protein
LALRRGVLLATAWSALFGQMWSRQHQERGIGVPLEGTQIRLMLPEQRPDLVCGRVTAPYPDHLRRVAAHKAELMEVRILGYDHEVLRRGVLPDGIIFPAAKPDVANVVTVREYICEGAR